MTRSLDPAHVEWSRRTFDIIAEGGGWGVPRSGLIFTKRNGRFELTSRLPHDPTMPISALRLRRQQAVEFGHIKRHFEAAGVPVVDSTEGKSK